MSAALINFFSIWGLLCFMLSSHEAIGQNILLQSSSSAVGINVTISTRQIVLSSYPIVGSNGSIVVLSAAKEVYFTEADFNADRLAREVLRHLRKAARVAVRAGTTSRSDIQAAGDYPHQLLLRPFQVIGFSGYRNARRARREFRRALADKLQEQHL